jgi:phospholipid transport system substrate-binding protein
VNASRFKNARARFTNPSQNFIGHRESSFQNLDLERLARPERWQRKRCLPRTALSTPRTSLQRKSMKRRFFAHWLAASAGAAMLALSPFVGAADEAPDMFIKRLSTEVLEQIKADKTVQAGDISGVLRLVESQIMPNVNFTRMTASAVGRSWREATPEQKKRLQEEFKILLVRTYGGALSQVKEQTVALKPLRSSPTDTEVLVRTEIVGRGDPIQLDYRLEKAAGAAGGWKIYDLNVLGVWLVETYRTQFSQEINANGVDGLIASLAQRNKSNAAGARKS